MACIFAATSLVFANVYTGACGMTDLSQVCRCYVCYLVCTPCGAVSDVHLSVGGTEVAAPPPFRLGDPALCGLIEHGFTSAPTQYRLYGRRFLQV